MKVAIIKYNAGNVQSVANALERLDADYFVTKDAAHVITADKVIFPGVGEAASAMKYLRENGLDKVIKDLTQPVLAICLGMQLLCASSEENDAECLGILPYRVRRFSGGALKVPHMGWNSVSKLDSKLFDQVPKGSRLYFVHSYFVETVAETVAVSSYGENFSSALHYKNFYGVQFHPEKSGATGSQILKNFLNL